MKFTRETLLEIESKSVVSESNDELTHVSHGNSLIRGSPSVRYPGWRRKGKTSFENIWGEVTIHLAFTSQRS